MPSRRTLNEQSVDATDTRRAYLNTLVQKHNRIMKTLLWIFFGLAVIGGAWYLFQGLTVPAPETAGEHAVTGTIKIGAIVPLTGAHAELGLALQKTGTLAIE